MANNGLVVALASWPDWCNGAELTISGELIDGTVFEGTDVIRVIDKGNKKK